MPSPTLKKALSGESSSLILMTELISTNKLTSQDLIELSKAPKSPNPHWDYLRATFLFRNHKTDGDLKTAINLLKLHAARGDGFAQNMLGLIYQKIAVPIDAVEKHLNKINYYFKTAAVQGNPFGLMNSMLLGLREENSESLILSYLPKIAEIYPKLSPLYQNIMDQKISEYIKKNVCSADGWYATALFCEKINKKNDMYYAFHQAITQDKGSKYIRKMIKAMERSVNKDLFFKTSLDAGFTKGYLDYLKDNIEAIEDKMSQATHTERQELSEELEGIALRLKSLQYLVAEKAIEFQPFLQEFKETLESTTLACAHILQQITTESITKPGASI